MTRMMMMMMSMEQRRGCWPPRCCCPRSSDEAALPGVRTAAASGPGGRRTGSCGRGRTGSWGSVLLLRLKHIPEKGVVERHLVQWFLMLCGGWGEGERSGRLSEPGQT